MTERNVPVQSLIDHIKTAVDVDPWAKEMAEELLKEQEAVEPTINEDGEAYCICGENVGIIPNSKSLPSVRLKYCPECGRRMKWE